MKSPDFTIVTANLNGGTYLRDCLRSVAAQEGASFEHLVIDGGSTDESAEIVAEFPDVIFHQDHDSGMSEAINRGFRKAKGRWVMWLNSDDRLKPGALRKVRQFAENHPAADVLYGGWDFVDGEGAFIRRMSVFPFRRLMLAHLGCYLGSTSCFLRRETTIAEGYFLNEQFHLVMDGEFYNRLARAGKRFVYLPRILAEFRRHGDNASLHRYSSEGIEGHLALQKQWAEGAAIRREYGISLFRGEHANGVVDALLYYFFLGQKAWLKRWHRLFSPLR